MSSDSPAVILYDSNGREINVSDGYALVVDQRGIISAGIDDSNQIRFLALSDAGALKVTSTESRIIVGEYLQGTDLIPGNNVVQNLISLENPTASGRTVYINRMSINGVVNGTSNIPFLYRLRRTAALPTGGTTLTAQKRDSTDATPVGIIRRGPTATAAGGLMWSTSPGAFTNKAVSVPNMFETVVTELVQNELVLAPGEAVLFTADANSNDWNHWINLVWTEETI
jgi:hypothetical protein